MGSEKKVKLKNNDDIIYPEVSDDVLSLDNYIAGYYDNGGSSFILKKTTTDNRGVIKYESDCGYHLNDVISIYDITMNDITFENMTYDSINAKTYGCEEIYFFGNYHLHERIDNYTISEDYKKEGPAFCLYKSPYWVIRTTMSLGDTIAISIKGKKVLYKKKMQPGIINNIGYKYDPFYNAISVGYKNICSDYNAIAIGISNNAKGNGSFSIGISNNANNINSYAIGSNNTSDAMNAITIGKNLINNNECCTCINCFNNNQPDSVFEIGNGTSDTLRSNAFRVTKDGKAIAQTALQIGDTVVTEDQLKKLLALIETTEE